MRRWLAFIVVLAVAAGCTRNSTTPPPASALQPALSSYRLGKDQIYALRQEGAKRLADRFSVKTFHVRFIRQGTIPPGYFGDALLAELQQAR